MPNLYSLNTTRGNKDLAYRLSRVVMVQRITLPTNEYIQAWDPGLSVLLSLCL